MCNKSHLFTNLSIKSYPFQMHYKCQLQSLSELSLKVYIPFIYLLTYHLFNFYKAIYKAV